MSHLHAKPFHCPTVSSCHFSPQSHIRFSAVSVVCWSSISLYIMRQFEKHSSCLGSPGYGSSTANCFPPRWLGIINWGVLGGRIQLPTIPAHTNAVQNLPFRPAWWQWLEHQGVMWSFCVFPTRCANVRGRFCQCPPPLFVRFEPVNKLVCQFISTGMFLFVVCHLLISLINIIFEYWTKGHKHGISPFIIMFQNWKSAWIISTHSFWFPPFTSSMGKKKQRNSDFELQSPSNLFVDGLKISKVILISILKVILHLWAQTSWLSAVPQSSMRQLFSREALSWVAAKDDAVCLCQETHSHWLRQDCRWWAPQWA